MQNYNFFEVEEKWKNYFLKNKTFKTQDTKKNKFYCLGMWEDQHASSSS